MAVATDLAMRVLGERLDTGTKNQSIPKSTFLIRKVMHGKRSRLEGLEFLETPSND